jgi:hypothetical protein
MVALRQITRGNVAVRENVVYAAGPTTRVAMNETLKPCILNTLRVKLRRLT